MVAIIGILAAVAIPAYNKYQENAKVGVIKSSLQQVIKGVNACLAVGQTTACGTNDVNGTVRQQAGTVITGLAGTAPTTALGTTNAFCFCVEYTGFKKACIDIDATGNPGAFPSDAQITDATTGSCTATTGAVAN